MADLAKAFGTEVERDCEVYSLRLPSAIGRGTIRGINFSSGLGLIFYDCVFEVDMEVHFDVMDIHPAKLAYALSGEVRHRFGDSDEIHHIRPYEGAIVGSSGKRGHVLRFPAGIHVMLSSVEVDRRKFVGAFACELKAMDSPIRHLLADVDAKEEFYHKGHLSLRHWELLSRIDNEQWAGVFRRLFLQSKATEILLWGILEYNDDQLEDSKKSMLRKSDVDTIYRAAGLIAQHLSNPINIEQLAEEVGTNSNKLQVGFKSLYGTTVNGYVQQMRLEKTCQYLETTELSISEIVARIGLSNHGYHSKMFKEAYGLSPMEYRKKMRGE